MIHVIRRPLISEKNRKHLDRGVYSFEVDKNSSKDDVRKAVEKLFRVKVVSVKTMLLRGKRRQTKFGLAKPTYYKKALVQLAPDNKIGLFEGV